MTNEKMLQFKPDGHIVYHSSRYGNPSPVKDDQVLADDGMGRPDGRRAALVKISAQGSSTATAQATLDGQTGRVCGDCGSHTFVPNGLLPMPAGGSRIETAQMIWQRECRCYNLADRTGQKLRSK